MSDGRWKADMHLLATERRKQGLPVWSETLDVSGVFHNDAMEFTSIRDAVVAAIKKTKWFANAKPSDPDTDDLRLFVDNLAESKDSEEFDDAWNEFYDLADLARVWIKTR